ncbi:hypothetical protein Adt_39660 [Abeliophyllum distichum]|uniref:Uncharacterized protein n=1 Tax=Abeliophyllum distichum TaxID=126358 RepID=A0ABD1Q6N7_9LAMI
MRHSLDQKDATAARQLDMELTASVHSGILIQSRFMETNMKKLWLAYDILRLVQLLASLLTRGLKTLWRASWPFVSLDAKGASFVRHISSFVVYPETSTWSHPDYPEWLRTNGRNFPIVDDYEGRVDRVNCINIASRTEELELDVHLLEMLSSSVAVAVTTVYKFWSSLWKRAPEKALLEKLVTISRGFVLNNELYSTLFGFNKEQHTHVNRDYDAMVDENDRLLAETWEETRRAKEELADIRA